MSILILNWRDPHHPLAGGAETSTLEHALFWKKKGADITWFASEFKGSKNEEIYEGISIIRKGSHFTVHIWAFLYYLLGKFGKSDVIVDCFHFIPFFTPLYVRHAKIVAFIHEVAGNVWYENIAWPVAFIGVHFEPLFFSIYQKFQFITVSKSTENELGDYGIQKSNITVINNGHRAVEMKNIKKEKKPTIIFLGRISKDKGIQDAIRVFENVYQKNNDASFWIVGKEEKRGSLQKMLNSKRGANIQYFGYVDNHKKYELLKRAWILVHTSVKEGWGLTVIEAASQETPTVGYKVAGLKDSIVDGKTGILVKKEPEELSEKINFLLKNPSMLKKLSQGAFENSKKFNWEESGKASWRIIHS